MANLSGVLPPVTRAKEHLSPRSQLVLDVFNMFDSDGSGEIELNEMAKAFKTTGKLTDETRAQLKAHFDFMDSDGSGEVTIDEFRAALGHREIAFRNYQHQQTYYALGLTLSQNLAAYRRHVLRQQFDSMKQQQQQQSSSGAATGSSFQDQFDCLARALLMSTFALNLKPLSRAPSGDGGGGGGGGGGGTGRGHEKGAGGRSTRVSEEGKKSAAKAGKGNLNDEELLRKREARVLARAIKAGESTRLLLPLPADRRRHLRAKILADVAAVKKGRDSYISEHIKTAGTRRKVLKKLPQKWRRGHGSALAF